MLFIITMISNIVLLLIPVIAAVELLGPADITLQRIEKCGADLLGTVLEINMKKINRTHLGLSSNITTPFIIDERIGVNVSVSKWGDGGWKPGVLEHYEPNCCEAARKYMNRLYTDILTTIGLEPKCPLPGGSYSFTNFPIDPNQPYPCMYGEFMAEVHNLRDGVPFNCIKAYVKIVLKALG